MMKTVEDVLSQTEWLLIHIDGGVPHGWDIGMTLLRSDRGPEYFDDDKFGRACYMLGIVGGLYMYYPSPDDYIVLPKTMFNDKELFVIKMSGGIDRVDWQSKMAYINDIFESRL